MDELRVAAIASLAPLEDLDTDPFVVDTRSQHAMCARWAMRPGLRRDEGAALLRAARRPLRALVRCRRRAGRPVRRRQPPGTGPCAALRRGVHRRVRAARRTAGDRRARRTAVHLRHEGRGAPCGCPCRPPVTTARSSPTPAPRPGSRRRAFRTSVRHPCHPASSAALCDAGGCGAAARGARVRGRHEAVRRVARTVADHGQRPGTGDHRLGGVHPHDARARRRSSPTSGCSPATATASPRSG